MYIGVREKFYDENKVRNAKVNYEGEERKPLNLEQLSGCFQLLIVGLVTSTFAFMAELMSKVVTKCIKLYN